MAKRSVHRPFSDDLKLAAPESPADWERYYDLRWRVLREPWGQPLGSERDSLDSQAFHLALTTPEDLPVAIGRLHLNSRQEAQVRYMAVEESWRGRGTGGRVLSGLEAEAHRLGATAIVLNAREEAVSFYINHGYRLEGPEETLFGEVRHFRMRKEIG